MIYPQVAEPHTLVLLSQSISDSGAAGPDSKEEAELAAWANDKLRGLLSPSDVQKLLSLLKASNISSVPLLKSMPKEDIFMVPCPLDS